MATETKETPQARVIVHFKGVSKDQEQHAELQKAVEKRCRHLAEEFAETNRFEVSISAEANELTAHAKASGKNTSVTSHASAAEPRAAAEAALDRLERELRRVHDKRIFAPRREARRAKAKRDGP